MKKAKDLTIGALVSVPDYCFAPLRSGWNGWIFKAGIIRDIGKNKHGVKIYKVERAVDGYSVTNKQTYTTWLSEKSLFEQSMRHSETVMKHPREYYDAKSYNEDTEFMIDHGFIEYPW